MQASLRRARMGCWERKKAPRAGPAVGHALARPSASWHLAVGQHSSTAGQPACRPCAGVPEKAPSLHTPLPHRRLGAVSGCLGDCWRAEGDAAGTLEHYTASVALLRAAGGDPEVRCSQQLCLHASCWLAGPRALGCGCAALHPNASSADPPHPHCVPTLCRPSRPSRWP